MPDAGPRPIPPEPPISSNSASIRITNAWSVAVTGVYLAPAADDDWGDNLLERPLVPGGSLTISEVPCTIKFDMLIVQSGGKQFRLPPMMFACGEVARIDLK